MAMKWIGKLTGGLLGGLVLGPLGAALGLLLGHQFDEDEDTPAIAATPQQLAAIGERFFRATFRVMGFVAKADGRVSELEIAAARGVMAELRLNASQVQEAIACFTAGKQPGFALESELQEMAQLLAGRRDLARVFLEIQVRAALAGNNLDGPVRPLLQQVAAALQVSTLEFVHIETYRVLETDAQASDEEVAKAYRRQLHRHHPDKLKANGLPESMLAHAKQRTQQIIEAWELVRERRGLR
jgi:DnaJ like chaperone protein